MIRKQKRKGNNSVKVTFVLPEDQPHGKVSVVGDFNGWDPTATPLVRRNNKTYSATATLEGGKRHAFRYYGEDGVWFNDEAADAYEPGAFGDDNSIVET